jgi:penicillin-binding protein 1A
MSLFHPTRTGIGPERRAPPKRRLLRRLPWEIRLTVLAAVYLGLPAMLALAGALAYYTAVLPNPMAMRHKEHAPAVRILARDGAPLSERGSADAYVPIDLLPRHLVEAVLAVEDRRFFEHRGLDPAGLARAALANLRAGRLTQGGSTLTQQLAKNLFLTSERTIGRKLEELALALWLEIRLSKRDILELYLNRVYFGAGAYGVETAAQRFFGKSAQNIELAEAAMLAGLLKAPSRFSPAWNPAVAKARARDVLAKMVEAGFLSADEAEQAARAPPRLAESLPHQVPTGSDYAVDAVLEQLTALIGPSVGEVVVETTIDSTLQRRAQTLVTDVLTSEGRKVEAGQAGLIVVDMDGGIRAVVGGRSYAESQFNRALKAKRQPGSAFKTFVYLAALESGLSPDSTVLDLPILGSGWSPRNEGAGYRGEVTLRDGLAQSMNAAAARLNMSIGPRKTAAVARRLGIRSPLREEASLALGTSEVTLLELTGAYGVFANGGRAVEPHLIERVRTASGKLLYERPKTRAGVLVAPEHVGALNDMLNAALVSGTGRRAALAEHPAAGKTGTSQDFRDAWFVGYTAHFAAGVWVGNDDRRAMNKVMGGSLPARLWHDVMVLAHVGYAAAPLPHTVPASSATLTSRGGQPAQERAGAPARLPKERIGPDFVERAIAADDEGKPDAAASPQQGKRTWLGTAVDRLRRGLGFGT